MPGVAPPKYACSVLFENGASNSVSVQVTYDDHKNKVGLGLPVLRALCVGTWPGRTTT